MPSQRTNEIIENFQNRNPIYPGAKETTPPPKEPEDKEKPPEDKKKATDWTEYIPEAKVNEKGQVTDFGYRKDIILNKLIEAGALKETISDYINKNPDVRFDDNIIFVYKSIRDGKSYDDIKDTRGFSFTKEGYDYIKAQIDANPGIDPYELGRQLAAHDIGAGREIIDTVGADGEKLTIVVNKDKLANAAKIENPQDKLDAYIELGILPEGTKLIGDGSAAAVREFNKRYNTNLDTDYPYALPNLVKYSEDFQKTEMAIQTLTAAGAYQNGELDLVKAIDQKIQLADMRAAGFDVTKKDIQTAQKVLDEINNASPELIAAFKKGGFNAYEKLAAELAQKEAAVNRGIKAGAGVAPMLTTEKAVSFQVETSPRILREAYAKGGAEAYNAAVASAYNILSPYKNKDGSYNILDAMLAARQAKTNKEDMAIADSLATLFPVDKIEKIRRDNLPRLTMGQEEGSIWGDSWSEAQASLPAWLVGSAGFTKGTPIPHDDAIMMGIITLAGGFFAVKNIISKTNKSSGSVGSGNLVVIGGNNARLIDPSSLFPTGGYISNIPPVSLPKGIPPLVPPYIKPTTGELLIPPSFKNEMEQLIGVREKVIFLPTPGVRFKAEDYIMDYVGLKQAEINLRKNIPDVAEIPINWNKLLDEAKNELARQKVFDDINKSISDLKAGGGDSKPTETLSDRLRTLERYETAHEEYMRKFAIWQAAWKSHIASLNPTPVRGKLDGKMLQALGIIELQRYINPNQVMYIHNLNQMSPERVLAGSPDIKKLLEQYQKAYQSALNKGLTDSQAETQAETNLQRLLKSMVQSQTLTKTQLLTRTQTQTQTQTKTQTKARIAEQEATDVMESAGTATRTIPLTAEVVRDKVKIDKLTKFRMGKGTDKEKREFIAEAGGAIAINTGEVGGKGNRKRVWDVVVKDYSGQEDYLQVLGAPPKGATIIRKGKGSAYATAQMLRGEPPAHEVNIDKGIMDINLKHGGRRKIIATFKPDPNQLTTGDITIGKPGISERPPSISERKEMPSRRRGLSISRRSSIRITPRMPRLR